MKYFFLIPLFLYSVFAYSQQNYRIEGRLARLKNGAKIHLEYHEGMVRKTDSAQAEEGKFTFRGTVQDITQARLSIKNGREEDSRELYLVEGTTHITGDSSLEKALISGTEVNNDNERFRKMLEPFRLQMDRINLEYAQKKKQNAIDSAYLARYYAEQSSLKKESRQLALKFIQDNPGSYISLANFMYAIGNDTPVNDAALLFEKLHDGLKAGKEGELIAKWIAVQKSVALGEQAPAFTQNDPGGKAVSLADFRGKYVLLEFWASWCAPCREENPNLIAAYGKYKNRGFTVLGISLDLPGKKEAWLKAISDDRLPWTQVSDLQFLNNAVARLYGVTAIPANFLLDSSGKIIARNLRGRVLQERLEQILPE